MSFIGVVIKGMSKGALFVAMPFYQKQFKKKLGFKPFPGTLNLRVTPRVKREIGKQNGIKISGKKGNGSAKCFAVEISGLQCFVIIPTKSMHPANTIEVLSRYNLRKKLHLRNGCRVKIEIGK